MLTKEQKVELLRGMDIDRLLNQFSTSILSAEKAECSTDTKKWMEHLENVELVRQEIIRRVK